MCTHIHMNVHACIHMNVHTYIHMNVHAYTHTYIHMNADIYHVGFPSGTLVKNPLANEGDAGSILGSGRSPGEGIGNPLQYFCLKNPMDSGAWWATIHGVTKSWTRLERLSTRNASHKKSPQSSSSKTSEKASISWDTLFSIFHLGS